MDKCEFSIGEKNKCSFLGSLLTENFISLNKIPHFPKSSFSKRSLFFQKVEHGKRKNSVLIVILGWLDLSFFCGGQNQVCVYGSSLYKQDIAEEQSKGIKRDLSEKREFEVLQKGITVCVFFKAARRIPMQKMRVSVVYAKCPSTSSKLFSETLLKESQPALLQENQYHQGGKNQSPFYIVFGSGKMMVQLKCFMFYWDSDETSWPRIHFWLNFFYQIALSIYVFVSNYV